MLAPGSKVPGRMLPLRKSKYDLVLDGGVYELVPSDIPCRALRFGKRGTDRRRLMKPVLLGITGRARARRLRVSHQWLEDGTLVVQAHVRLETLVRAKIKELEEVSPALADVKYKEQS